MAKTVSPKHSDKGEHCRNVTKRTSMPNVLCPNEILNDKCQSQAHCKYEHRLDLDAPAPSKLESLKSIVDSASSRLLGAMVNSELHEQVQSLCEVLIPPCLKGKPVFPKFASPSKIHEDLMVRVFYEIENDTARFLRLVDGESNSGFFSYITSISEAKFTIGPITKIPRGSISYERVLIVLLYVLAHPSISNSPLRHITNKLYAHVDSVLCSLLVRYICGLKDHILNVSNATFSAIPTLQTLSAQGAVVWKGFVPMSTLQFIAPMLRLLEILFERFTKSSRPNYIANFLSEITTLIEIWNRSVESSLSSSPVESPHAVRIAEQLLERLKLAVVNVTSMEEQIKIYSAEREACAAAALEESAKAETEVGKTAGSRSTGPSAWIWEPVEPPVGTNNDCADYRYIRVMPQGSEVRTTKQPVLPGNLPFDPNAHWLPPGPIRMLDTHFRLLRQDMMSIIKPGLAFALSRVEDGKDLRSGRSIGVHNGHDFDIMVFHVRRWGFPVFSEGMGVGFSVVIWSRTLSVIGDTCLTHDTLVCLICRNLVTKAISVRFCLVMRERSEMRKIGDKRKGIIKNREFLQLRLPTSGSLRFMQELEPLYVVECPKLMFEAYRPILTALQERSPISLPFSDLICPPSPLPCSLNQISPPAYANVDGFSFDITFLLKKSKDGAKGNASSDNDERLLFYPKKKQETAAEFVQKLVQRTTLDKSQAEAITLALSSRIACIQGPPGTGKTHVGTMIVRALVEGQRRLKSGGPIIILCYTNHALDQFLERLLDADVKDIARIGRNCTKRMEEYVSRRGKTSRDFYKCNDLIKDCIKQLELSHALNINGTEGNSAMITYLKTWRSKQYDILISGFRNFGSNCASSEILEFWLHGCDIKNQKNKRRYNRKAYKEMHAVCSRDDGDDNDDYKDDQDVDDDVDVDVDGDVDVDVDVDVDDDDDDGNANDVDVGTNNSKKCSKESSSEDKEGKISIESGKMGMICVNAHKSDLSLFELLKFEDVWQLNLNERKVLNKSWEDDCKKMKSIVFEKICAKLDSLQKIRNNLLNEAEIEGLKSKRVIGLTTTGAAKRIQTLLSLKPSVMVCEEAGEILEAHSLACMVQSIQHCILIGDHKQLRPKIQSFGMSCESRNGRQFGLDVSLFERLVLQQGGNSLHCCLATQRRMKPCMSQHVRDIMYPHLLDDKTTMNRPKIRGIDPELYFWSHEYQEDRNMNRFDDEGFGNSSRSNKMEAASVVMLLKYLLLQGYGAADVVILTPYLGQLQVLSGLIQSANLDFLLDSRDEESLRVAYAHETNEAKNENKIAQSRQNEECQSAKIRVSTIDNFQGEESDIVIVSLVRGAVERQEEQENEVHKNQVKPTIGFLKHANRVNVLLSRAKLGLYLVGNAKTFEEHGGLYWQRLISKLRTDGQIGPGLKIFCQRHPGTTTEIFCDSQLMNVSPDGGCLLPCEFRYDCGHMCPRVCHLETDHELYRCKRKCERLHLPCEHLCDRECGEDCGKCMTLVSEVKLDCDHVIKNIYCYQVQERETFKCSELIEVERYCGHKVQAVCGQDESKVVCKAPCKALLSCQHRCPGICGHCIRKSDASSNKQQSLELVTNHQICNQKCDITLICGHTCGAECWEHEEDENSNALIHPPCMKPCTGTICGHGKCRQKCSQPCVPCLEPCTWQCEHRGKCILPCGAPCIRLPCDERCQKKLECGHQCPSVCGEICPDKKFCQMCGDNLVQGQCADLIMMQIYSDIDLDETPIVVLKCGHVFSVETMDATAKLASFYKRDENTGNWLAPAPLNNIETFLLKCPLCRLGVTLHNTRRYSRVVNSHNLALSNGYANIKLLQEINRIEMVVRQLETSNNTNITSVNSNIEKVEQGVRDLFRKVQTGPSASIYGAMKRAILKAGKSTHEKPEVSLKLAEFQRFHSRNEEAKLHMLLGRGKCVHVTCLSKNSGRFSIVELEMAFKRARMSLRAAKEGFEVDLAYYRVLTVLESQANLAYRFMRCIASMTKESIRKEQKNRNLKIAKNYIGAIDCELGNANIVQLESQSVGALINNVKNLIKDTQDLIKNPRPVIDQEAFKSVARALSQGIGYERGRFYFCPNGHIYMIGDCGQAMTVGVCFECDAEIGGNNHRLLATNSEATNYRI